MVSFIWILAKSSEIKFLLPSTSSDKSKKKSLKKEKESAENTAANNSQSKTASVNDLHLPVQNESQSASMDSIKVSKKSLSGKKKKKKKKLAKSASDDIEPETFA